MLNQSVVKLIMQLFKNRSGRKHCCRILANDLARECDVNRYANKPD